MIMNGIPTYLQQFNYNPRIADTSSNDMKDFNRRYCKRNTNTVNQLYSHLAKAGISGNDTLFLLENYPNYFNEINSILKTKEDIDNPRIKINRKNKSVSTTYLIPKSLIEYETEDSDGAVLEFELENPNYDLATDDNVLMQTNTNDITQTGQKFDMEEDYYDYSYDEYNSNITTKIGMDDWLINEGSSDYIEKMNSTQSLENIVGGAAIMTNLPCKWTTANEVTFGALAGSKKANLGLRQNTLRIINGKVEDNYDNDSDNSSGGNSKSEEDESEEDEDESMEIGSAENTDIDPKALLAFISNVPIPKTCPIFYYEVKIKTDITDYNLSLGLIKHHKSVWSLPGLQESSFGYNGQTGLFNIGNSEIESLECFGKGDTVGCGTSPVNNQIFFTKNGEFLRSYYIERNIFYPVIGFINGADTEINKLNRNGRASSNTTVPSAAPIVHEIVTNFGETPFLFNINDYSARLIHNRYMVIYKDNYLLEKTNFNNFGKSKKDNDNAIIDDDEENSEEPENFIDYTIDRPDIFMNDIQTKQSINTLIKDYLMHYGYGNTLKSLQGELLTNNKKIEPINEIEMNEKKLLRELILSNKFDILLNMIEENKIKIQKSKRNTKFDLKCLKLINMIQIFLTNDTNDIDGSQIEKIINYINKTNEEFGNDLKKKFIMMIFIKVITDKDFNSDWLTCSSKSLEYRTIINSKFYNADELKILHYIKLKNFKELKYKIIDSIFLNYESNRKREISKIEKLINLTNSTLKQSCFESHDHLDVNHFLI